MADKSNKSSKTHPDQKKVSGISAAALKGAKKGAAQGAAQGTESESTDRVENSEKLARPGPGLTDPRTNRTTSGSMESAAQESSDASVESLSEDEARQWRQSEDASPDDFEEGEEDVER